MALFRSFPNQFSVSNLVTTSTSLNSTSVLTSTAAMDFGFAGSLLKLIVDLSGPAYVQFNGQTATTNDYQLSTGDLMTDWYDIGVGASGVSITATSTSLKMRVGVWG